MINETLEADREYQKAIAEAKRQAIKSSDCIDRQAAIKVVEIPVVMTGIRGGNSGTVNAVNAFKSIVIDGLRALPPAEPEIIRCKDCVNYNDHRCTVANHHVSEKENCAEVFGAERR